VPVIAMEKPIPESVLKGEFKSGEVFSMCPAVMSLDRRRTLSWGDTVLITERGVRRLGKGRGEMIIV
jgi:hypothetical protein